MRLSSTFIAIGCLVLVGCFPGADEVHRQTTNWLCANSFIRPTNNVAGGQTFAAEMRAELNARGAMNDRDWALVDTGKITYGMSRCALEAIYGAPAAEGHARSALGETETLAWPGVSAVLTSDKVTSFTVVALPQ